MPEYARVCQSMPEYTRVCQSMQEYARVCQSIPECARICQSLAKFCPSHPNVIPKLSPGSAQDVPKSSLVMPSRTNCLQLPRVSQLPPVAPSCHQLPPIAPLDSV